MARKVRYTNTTAKPRPSPVAAGAADAAYRRTWIALGLVSVWLAVMGFAFIKNAAGQRLWYVPIEILTAYGILLGISCWRRSRARQLPVDTHPLAAPPPMIVESCAPSVPQGVESIEERLTRLSEMRSKGLITPVEYEARKRKIIEEI